MKAGIGRVLLAAMMLGMLPTAMVAQTPKAAGAKAQAATASVNGDKIDLNSATADQLKTIPGIGDAYAKRIIDNRPYSNKGQLTSKGVLPQGVYDKVKDKVIATQVKK